MKKEDIYKFNPADFFDEKVTYRLFSVLDKETGQLISKVMLPQEDILNLKEEEITEKAFRAAERIKRVSESLSPEHIDKWANELKKGAGLEKIIGLFVLEHILNVSFYRLNGEVTFKEDDPKYKDALKQITKLIKEVTNETERYKDLAVYMATNLFTWTLEDIDNALGAEKVAALTDDEWTKTFYSYLYDDNRWPFKDRLEYLLNIYAQDYAKAFIEALDLPNKSIDDIEKLLKIPLRREIYYRVPQSAHTNKMARKLASKFDKAFQIALNGKASLIEKDFQLHIEGIEGLKSGANTSAVKLFDAAIMNCIENRTTLARMPLKDYMALRGLKDEKSARRQIKADIDVLKRVKLEYKGTGKRRGDWLSISLYGGRAGIYNGIIEFRFTPETIASIPENQYMYIPPQYFATNDKYNPHTAYFIRRIAEHKRMNLGKPNENIISVKTLTEASPLFPKYEEVNYQFTQKILEPFERDMDAMKNIKWHYDGDEPESYDEFIKSNVIITWTDYPNVEKLTQRKQLAAKKKKKNSKKEG